MTDIENLLHAERTFLTDGGLETWMVFNEGFVPPEFASIVFLDDPAALDAARAYFDRFLAGAATAGAGFVLDTMTWRGGPHWAEKLDRTKTEMMQLNRRAVDFAHDIRAAWTDKVAPILVNGVIGPAGDGYVAGVTPDAVTAEKLHAPQIRILAEAGADMISAVTMTNIEEGIGIARASKGAGLPVVISYTLETDGCLPTGEPLADAIRATDWETGSAPIYYMINCAHPDHFRDVLASGDAAWLNRIGGVRANASRLSHAELDVAETLDDGDPDEFGRLHLELARLLPNLRVVGGCCGTDHRHVGCVSDHLHARKAA